VSAPVLEFWFEFASTYSHLSAQRIESVAEAAGVRVVHRPFLLGPIFKNQGWHDSPFNLYAAKGAYMWRDVARVAAKHGIAFRKPSVFPRNGLLPARIATAGESEEWLGPFVRAVYLANFRDDVDVSDVAVARRLLGDAGAPDPAAVLARAESLEVKTRLRESTEEAAVRGIFGAPSFLVGDELFWGDDRLEDAVEWCRARLETGAGA
jgi:2-hydroxychromene-2-carboxylate isomerase